jgi:hypothetical protein
MQAAPWTLLAAWVPKELRGLESMRCFDLQGSASRISAGGGRTGHDENVPAARESHAACERRARAYGAARGVASADRLTDLRIEQARTLTAGDSVAEAVSAGRVGAACSAPAH